MNQEMNVIGPNDDEGMGDEIYNTRENDAVVSLSFGKGRKSEANADKRIADEILKSIG